MHKNNVVRVRVLLIFLLVCLIQCFYLDNVYILLGGFFKVVLRTCFFFLSVSVLLIYSISLKLSESAILEAFQKSVLLFRGLDEFKNVFCFSYSFF